MPIGIFPWFNNIWKNLKIMHDIFTDLFSFEVLKLILGEGISDAYESFFNIFNIKFNIFKLQNYFIILRKHHISPFCLQSLLYILFKL